MTIINIIEKMKEQNISRINIFNINSTELTNPITLDLCKPYIIDSYGSKKNFSPNDFISDGWEVYNNNIAELLLKLTEFEGGVRKVESDSYRNMENSKINGFVYDFVNFADKACESLKLESKKITEEFFEGRE